jgi:hypothetical protein
MSGFWNAMDTRARRLGIVEVKLAQGAAMGLALAIGKAFPELMDLSVWWFLGFALVCALLPARSFYGGGDD